jgi:glycosyltransferase domain-containing protein
MSSSPTISRFSSAAGFVDQLTIILTLKDRSAFTYRWMRYMNDSACPYPILIADGGADPVIEQHLQNADNYPRLRYTYVRYPLDHNHACFYRKLADVISRVTTPYLLLADNDDFYLLPDIPRFIQFLEEHDNFVSCGGKPVVLRLLSSDHREVGAPSGSEYCASVDDRPKSVTHDSGVDRLCYFLDNVEPLYLWSTWYQIHRTAALTRAARFLETHEFTELVAFEIHVHVCLLFAGKYQTFDEPFLVGQLGTSQATADLNRSGNLVERFIRSNAFEDVRRSLSYAAPGLSEADIARIQKSIAGWFAQQAAMLYPAPRPSEAKSIAGSIRRRLRPLSRLARRRIPEPARMQLPAIEPYVVDR